MFKKAGLLLNVFVAGSLLAQSSPINESSSSSEWTELNKATLLRGEVSRGKTLLFTVERLGNVAYLKLPENPTALQRGFWIFEVNHAGQSSFATWNNEKKAWKFVLTEKGNYTIYVSKRKNKSESIPHSWFVLTF